MRYGSQCVLCGDQVLQVFGWDNGVGGEDCVLSPWNGAGTRFEGFVHFSCVQNWEHREAFFTELSAVYSDRGGRGEVIDHATGTLVPFQRDLAERTAVAVAEGGRLLLRDTQVKRWTVIDPSWGWVGIDPKTALALASNDSPVYDPGYERMLFRQPLPEGAETWPLPELLTRLGLDVRYPGLGQVPGAAVDLKIRGEDRRGTLTAVVVPVAIPEWSRSYFQGLLAAEGPTAFDELRYDFGSELRRAGH